VNCRIVLQAGVQVVVWDLKAEKAQVVAGSTNDAGSKATPVGCDVTNDYGVISKI